MQGLLRLPSGEFRRSLPWLGQRVCAGALPGGSTSWAGLWWSMWAGLALPQRIGADPRDNDFSRGHRGAAGGHRALHQHSWIQSEHLSVLLDSTLLLILGAVFAFVRLFW